MQLKPTDAAQALQVDEKTVLRWIRNDNLPAEQIRGDYQINRVDLLEWATERGIKVNPAIFELDDGDDVRPLPPLSQALEAGGIHCNVAGTDIPSVLHQVVTLLNLPEELDPDFVLQVLLAREAMGTTAVGDGIAIPHVRNPLLVRLPVPKVSLCFLAQPIDFGAVDDKPVHILFTITSPTVRTHLHLLSKLAYALRDDRLRQVLKTPCQTDLILSTLRQIEVDMARSST
jgi:PTS system nitrogen regulatory IIA component